MLCVSVCVLFKFQTIFIKQKKGLKFGIHVMRGINKAAIDANTPIFGTNNQIFAKDITNFNEPCPWKSDFYAVNTSAKGAKKHANLRILFIGCYCDFAKKKKKKKKSIKKKKKKAYKQNRISKIFR